MPTYTYEALNSAGKAQKGTVEAASSDEAITRIKQQGYFPTSVREQRVKGAAAKGGVPTEEAKKKKKKKKGGSLNISIGGVPAKRLTLFTRQMSTLQDAGLPLLRSINILEQQQKPGKLKSILSDVAEDVEAGSTLSDAMAKHPRAFDRLYTKMINAGEIGGVLDVILQRLASFLEKAQRLRRRIIGAMIYPVVVVSIAVLIVTGIMVFVIPKFKEIFDDFGVTLPWLTVFLTEASAWVAGTNPGQTVPGAVWVLASPVLIFLVMKLIRMTGPGRAVTDVIRVKLPIIGGLVRKTSVARFTRTLGTLISAGVPILEAIMITRDTSGNYVYESALTKVHDSIREGESFAGPLREAKVCDSIVVNMIDVGEETGDLDTMLMKIADNYDEEVDVAVQGLVSLLEPLLVVVLGVVIGTIVLALFMPLVTLIEQVSTAGA